MNAQQELVAFWKYCESRGLKPSIRKCILHVRSFGIKCDEMMARKALSEFSALAPHPMCRAPHKSITKTAPLVQSDAQPPRLHAHNKVSLVSEPLPQRPTVSSPRVRPIVEVVTFDAEDERRVTGIMAIEAGENKTATITEQRVLLIRSQLRGLLTELGSGTWRYAMDEALARGKPSRYAIAVARKHRSEKVVPINQFSTERPAVDSIALARAKSARLRDAVHA